MLSCHINGFARDYQQMRNDEDVSGNETRIKISGDRTVMSDQITRDVEEAYYLHFTGLGRVSPFTEVFEL